jgi:hypothetical protein
VDKKSPKVTSKLQSLLKNVFVVIACLLVLLILLYATFKVWDHIDAAEQKSKIAKLAKARDTSLTSEQKQKQKYDVLSKDLTMSLPLFVGTPSLEFVKGGNKEFIFSYLLGEDYPAFQEALGDSQNIVFAGHQIFGSGCKKQACSELKAAFLVDSNTSEFLAVILDNGKPIYYGLSEGVPVPGAFEKWMGAQTVGRTK